MVLNSLSAIKNPNHKELYKTGYTVYYIAYALSLVGFSFISTKYMEIFISCIKVYISLLLIWKFNPYKRIIIKKLSDHDRDIIYNSAIFLLLTSALGEYLIKLQNKIAKRKEVKNLNEKVEKTVGKFLNGSVNGAAKFLEVDKQ